MKNIVMMISCTAVGVITLMIIMTVSGRMNRSMELKSNLSSIVEETVEIMTVNPKYNIADYDTYIADFISNLSDAVDSDSALSVEVLNADDAKGLLSIRVTEEFRHPNGSDGTVACERTVFLNKLDETEQGAFTVRFYVSTAQGEQKCYKSCQVLAGDAILAPANPVSAGAAFGGWVDSNNYLADFTQPVMQDIEYYAVWN